MMLNCLPRTLSLHVIIFMHLEYLSRSAGPANMAEVAIPAICINSVSFLQTAQALWHHSAARRKLIIKAYHLATLKRMAQLGLSKTTRVVPSLWLRSAILSQSSPTEQRLSRYLWYFKDRPAAHDFGLSGLPEVRTRGEGGRVFLTPACGPS